MLAETVGLTGFREYLSSYWGKWASDSGPIVRGIVVAVTRLGMKAARTIGDIRASGARTELRSAGVLQSSSNVSL